jgi:hypothetical protein
VLDHVDEIAGFLTVGRTLREIADALGMTRSWGTWGPLGGTRPRACGAPVAANYRADWHRLPREIRLGRGRCFSSCGHVPWTTRVVAAKLDTRLRAVSVNEALDAGSCAASCGE